MSKAPEPTFLEKLRKAREAATLLETERRSMMDDFFEKNPAGGRPTKAMVGLGERLVAAHSELTALLVDNSAKIERLLEAVDRLEEVRRGSV